MYAFPAASNARPAQNGEIGPFEPGIALENNTFPPGSTRCRIHVDSGPRPYTTASPLAATARARNGGKSGCGRVTSSQVTPSGANRASPAPTAMTTSAPVGSTAMAPGTIGTCRAKSIPPDAYKRTTSAPTREEYWAFGSPATYTPPVGSTAIAPANPRLFCQRMVAPSTESLVTQYVDGSLAGHGIMV